MLLCFISFVLVVLHHCNCSLFVFTEYLLCCNEGRVEVVIHILLCTTVWHLYHIKQLTPIPIGLSHCETHVFGLELETTLAKDLDEVSISLTPQITARKENGNEVFHLEWHNMNKIITIIHDSDVVNRTDWIMIQEVKPEFDASNKYQTLPVYKQRQTLPESWYAWDPSPKAHLVQTLLKVRPRVLCLVTCTGSGHQWREATCSRIW